MDSAYSFSLTTFSPSGKLLQIEYALNAVNQGKMSVGVAGNSFVQILLIATNGVVIATERKVPTVLIEEESIQKVVPLSDNIGRKHYCITNCSRCLFRNGP